MANTQPYVLIYDPEINAHLDAIESKHHGLIKAEIKEQLEFEPDRATRNRKQLKRPIKLGAGWELRIGPGNRFRVFYRVDAEQHEVRVLAIGVKINNRVYIAGEEVEL